MHIIFTILIIFLLSCDEDKIFIDFLYPRQAISEYQTLQNSNNSTIPGCVILLSLENPKFKLTNNEIDNFEIGIDKVDIFFEFNAQFTFRIQDNSIFKVKLINKNNNNVIFELNNTNTFVDIFINSGNYYYEFSFIEGLIPESLRSIPIFVQPDIKTLTERNLNIPSQIGNYKNIDISTFFSSEECIECNIQNVNVSYMNLQGSENKLTNFSKSNLKSIKGFKTNLAYSNFDEVIFNGAKLDSSTFAFSFFTNLKDVNYSTFYFGDFRSVVFDNCISTFASFDISNFKFATLKNSTFTSSSFRGIDIQESTCIDNDLSLCSFRGAYLNYSNFSNNNLYGADLSYADVRGTNFCGSNQSLVIKNEVLTNNDTKCYEK